MEAAALNTPPFVAPPVAYAPPPPPPPPVAAPIMAEIEEPVSNSFVKDTNWMAVLVSTFLVAMSIAVIYHSVYKVKYYNKKFNNFQAAIGDLRNDHEDLRKEIDNQNFLESQPEQPINIW